MDDLEKLKLEHDELMAQISPLMIRRSRKHDKPLSVSEKRTLCTLRQKSYELYKLIEKLEGK